jgi:hypothetical protein
MCTKFVIFVFVFFYIIYVYRAVLEKVCLNLECNEFIVAKLYMDPGFFHNKTDRHDITEILLKVASNTKNLI